jgi:hypothetical protein
MVASITHIQSPFNFLANQIFICYCHSQVLELSYIFRGSVGCVDVMILPYILVTRQHMLNFLCVYF